MSQLLTINELSVDIQGKEVLTNVNLTLEQGDILGLVGASGCGKTTLLNTIAGFINQVSGKIVLKDLAEITPDNCIAPEVRNIGMIFQDYALFPHLTVWQNIAFGIGKLAKGEQESRINNLLGLLQISDYAQRYPHQLSGGQQQRVAIARALAPQPTLLLLDEPFSNIDARLRSELMVELRGLLKKLAISAIFVTHNKDEVFSFADKMAVMNQGKVLQSGEPHAVYHHPNSWHVADFLQIGSWLKVRVDGSEVATPLGDYQVSQDFIEHQGEQWLLVKPQHLQLVSGKPVNATISHISVTEHGFKYLLNNLNGAERSFEHLVFYHTQAFKLGEELAIEIAEHQYQLFSPAK